MMIGFQSTIAAFPWSKQQFMQLSLQLYTNFWLSSYKSLGFMSLNTHLLGNLRISMLGIATLQLILQGFGDNNVIKLKILN